MSDQPCVQCGNWPSSKDQHCTHCGIPLQNKCTYPGGLTDDPCTHVNSAQAAFCAQCGSPTTYYQLGIVQTAYAAPPRKVVNEAADELHLFEHPFFSK